MNKIPFIAAVALLSLTLSSCRISAPTFKTVDNLRFDKMNGSSVKVGADLVFYNPNPIRIKITDIAADVTIDKRQMGTIGEKSDIIIKRKSDFRVPLGLTIKPDGSLLDNLKTVFGFITDKEIELAIRGKIKLKWLFIKREVPVNYMTKVKASQLK